MAGGWVVSCNLEKGIAKKVALLGNLPSLPGRRGVFLYVGVFAPFRINGGLQNEGRKENF
jgi:hypothetical protein